MRVVHSLTDLYHDFKPLRRVQPLLFRVIQQRRAMHKLHGEVLLRTHTGFRCPCFVDLRYARMLQAICAPESKAGSAAPPGSRSSNALTSSAIWSMREMVSFMAPPPGIERRVIEKLSLHGSGQRELQPRIGVEHQEAMRAACGVNGVTVEQDLSPAG